jgi:dephospho-CoA kinase
MLKIGLTGGIGSGKTVVAQLLAVFGLPVYNADLRAKMLTATSPQIREQLTERFGSELFASGSLDRRLLASLIFGNDDNLQFVNATVHPHVFADFSQWRRQYADYKAVVAESAILFESGFRHSVDFAVAVSAPLEIRIGRIIARDGCSREDAIRRIKSQMPDEEKQSRANLVIINDDHQAILPQTEKMLKFFGLNIP